MTTQQCDVCQRLIGQDGLRDDPGDMHIRRGWKSIDLCKVCARPVLQVLKEYEIDDNKWLKNLLSSSKDV